MGMTKDMKDLSILIAYNDEGIIKLLSTIIDTKYSAKIDIAKNVPEFHEHTKTKDYDIILMDFLFSNDTFSLIKNFRQQNKDTCTPMALFTSYLTETDYMRAVELNIFDFLTKPFSLDHIRSTIDYILYQKGCKKDSNDRRRAVRSNKKLIIKYKRDYHQSHTLQTEDVSINGLRFNNGKDFFKNEEIELDIVLDNPYDNRIVHTTGIVRWIKPKEATPNENTIGVEFRNLNISDRLRLSDTLYYNL
jgi:DNA-binding response OmpR family regulator